MPERDAEEANPKTEHCEACAAAVKEGVELEYYGRVSGWLCPYCAVSYGNDLHTKSTASMMNVLERRLKEHIDFRLGNVE